MPAHAQVQTEGTSTGTNAQSNNQGAENEIENEEVSSNDNEGGAGESGADEGHEEEVSQQRPAKKGGNLQAALNEERAERKRLAAEVKAAREERERLVQEANQNKQWREKMNSRLAQLFGNDEVDGTEASFEKNPAEYLRKETETVKQQQAQFQQFLEQQRTMQQVSSFAQSDVAQFKQQTPDYDDAYGFVRQARVQELMAIHEISDVEAAALVNQEELGFVADCLQKKKSPARALYNYAKARGYKPAGEGGAQTLDTLQRGINGSKSLSNTPGKANGVLTMEQIAAMDDDEFAAWKAKNPKRYKQLMGGE